VCPFCLCTYRIFLLSVLGHDKANLCVCMCCVCCVGVCVLCVRACVVRCRERGKEQRGRGIDRVSARYWRREEMVQHVTVECGIMQHITFHRIASQGFTTQRSTLEYRTSHFNTHNANCASQRNAFRFRTLQHGAAHHGTFSTVQPTHYKRTQQYKTAQLPYKTIHHISTHDTSKHLIAL
jgi:hypothetical protein